jgi:HK97 family phage major capsid protein
MLKQLKIQKALELKRQKLQELETKANAILKRSEDATVALAETSNEEDLQLLETEITKIEEEQTALDSEKRTVEEEISALETELQDVEARSKEASKQRSNQEKGKGANEPMNRFQVKELLRTGEYYKQADVIEFYEKFKNLRAVTGGELQIPYTVVNRIIEILGDYATVYPLVDKIRINGSGRILIDTDTTAASWIEQNAALPTADVGTLTYVDFDGFKVGKVTFVDNYMLQDSIINLDNYVARKIARAIAMALDIAILNGTGAANKQPTGIIPSIPSQNLVSVAADANFIEFVKPIGLVDTGLDQVLGEIVAVMKRTTYYNHFLQFSLNVDDSGKYVGMLPNLTQPNILGVPVVFSNAMADDQVLYGDFQRYTLVERENITIDNSSEIRFVEDQMAFRGKGRFDGKVTRAESFALMTITPAAV